jgi:predicted AAA+ superfamily ATPase
MLDFIQRFIAEGKIVLEQVVFLNLIQYANKTIDPLQLLDSYYKKFPNLKPFFVLDEVQDIANFRELVLFLFDHQYKIFISGSNSKLLAGELSTHFRGRIFEYKVYPLTFPEVLSFNEFPIKKQYAVTDKAKIKYLYQDVFTYGAFPELVIAKSEFTKREILRSYFDILLYKDLIERYKIESESNLQYLMEYLTIGFTKDVSIHKVFTTLKSKQIKI